MARLTNLPYRVQLLFSVLHGSQRSENMNVYLIKSSFRQKLTVETNSVKMEKSNAKPHSY